MHSAKSHIMLVDDAPTVRESLSWLLQDQPDLLVVGDASNGFDAIKLAIKLKPDLVILDIELPDIDGFTMTRQLKALCAPPSVVLLSKHSDSISKRYGAASGCDAFVEKECGWSTLLFVLHAVLEKRKI